jgi:hypothetical protein
MTAWIDASNFNGEPLFFRVNLDRWMVRIAALVREFGPYALIELVLPGGSLIALSLWLYRRHKNASRSAAQGEREGKPSAAPMVAAENIRRYLYVRGCRLRGRRFTCQRIDTGAECACAKINESRDLTIGGADRERSVVTRAGVNVRSAEISVVKVNGRLWPD